MDKDNFENMFSYENILRSMDDINEHTYGVRPYGTKREIKEEPTVQELTISEMVGRPVRIKK